MALRGTSISKGFVWVILALLIVGLAGFGATNLSGTVRSVGAVGDKLQLPYVKNYGYINQKKLNKILSKTKFTIASGENIYSFFSLDCINNHTTIFIDKKHIRKKIEYNSFFKVINLKNIVYEIKKHTITKNIPIKTNTKKLRSYFVVNW